LGAAAGVAALHGLLAWLILTGLGIDIGLAPPPRERLAAFDVRPPPPPPPIPAPERVKGPEGAAAPPSREARPTPVVAPRRNARSPVRAAPEPKPLPTGSDTTAGASRDDGPGSGSGGQGSGAGAGRGGGGTGGGLAAPARRISGRLADRDYPGRGPRPGVESVGVRFTVRTDGRVSNCTVTRSSGNAALDATTCRLIERDFRYRPATGPDGQPVVSLVNTIFDWIPPEYRRRRR
jgi:protein TonB